MNSNRGIFLDRDGTLNSDVGYAHRIEDLQLLPNAIAGLRAMAALGFKLFITTNQSGIARGYFSEEDMQRFNAELCRRLECEGVIVSAVYYCPFHPTEGRGAYRRESPFRKPQPGMILQAAAEHNIELAGSFTIGDRMSDIAAGKAAGCRTILVTTGECRSATSTEASQPDYIAVDVLDAAGFIKRCGKPSYSPATAQGLSTSGGYHHELTPDPY